MTEPHFFILARFLLTLQRNSFMAMGGRTFHLNYNSVNSASCHSNSTEPTKPIWLLQETFMLCPGYLIIVKNVVYMDLVCPSHLSMWAALKTTSNSSLSNWAAFSAISAASKSRDSSSKNWPEEGKGEFHFIFAFTPSERQMWNISFGCGTDSLVCPLNDSVKHEIARVLHAAQTIWQTICSIEISPIGMFPWQIKRLLL